MSEIEKAKISWTGWYTAKVQEGCTAVSIERWAHWYCGGDDDKAESLSREILAGIKGRSMKTKPHFFVCLDGSIIQGPNYSKFASRSTIKMDNDPVPWCMVSPATCDKVREFAAWVLSEIPTVYVEERVKELLKLLPEVEQ